MTDNKVVELIKEALVKAGSSFTQDKKDAYYRALEKETNERARWVIETTLANAEAAEKNKTPLCDDTGIPHILIELGPNKSITYSLLESINEGIREGLNALPGRPMALMGCGLDLIDQSGGVSMNPTDVVPAPFSIRQIEEDVIKINVLLFGGGPAIRGKTYRVFHKHDSDVVLDEIVEWATEGVGMLGCSPSTVAVGIGRSHYEATSLMLQALVDGNHNIQSEVEQKITDRLNQTDIGPLGLKGDTSVLATFLKIGPQRSSGVRIVSVMPACSIEPRIATVILD